MTSPLTSFVGIQFIIDPNGSTPPGNVQYDQQVFMLPPEYLSGLGSGPGNPGTIDGVRGYHQAGGPTGHQWVMTSSISGPLVTQFNGIPGPRGWVLPSARTTFRNLAVQLVETYGVVPADALTALGSAYNAAVANDHAVPPGG